MTIGEFYIKNLKKLQLIPLIMLLLALGILFHSYFATGNFLEKDISLKGGSILTINTDKDSANIESFLESKFPGYNFATRKLTEFGTSAPTGVIIETSYENTDELKSSLEEFFKIKLNQDNFSVEVTGASLGKAFSSQTINALIVAFILMAIVVFITFRVFVPSIAVIFAAIFDILISMGGMNILGIKLSIPTAAALLLLIGYSVDTDILLTTRILKRKSLGNLDHRIFDSIKTGTTMTFAALAALGIGYFVTNSFIMKSMFLVIIMGLVADLFSTWLVNVYILKLYAERSEKNV